MVKFKEERKLSREAIRTMCIREEYYTRGDCVAYEDMFKLAESKEATTEHIQDVAYDICNHSNFSAFCTRYGYGEDDFEVFLAHIMYLLINDCTYTRLYAEEP